MVNDLQAERFAAELPLRRLIRPGASAAGMGAFRGTIKRMAGRSSNVSWSRLLVEAM